ncbi:hypothetical protein [Roseovarius albus]|uniref:hypothetical protein n=1 Tax=Roseovarius albus TaxID=1247867 RepID=UPI001F2826A3|nr:hypothetical protein [Roseovarius albus]
MIGRVGPIRVFGDKFNSVAVGIESEETAPADWVKKTVVIRDKTRFMGLPFLH